MNDKYKGSEKGTIFAQMRKNRKILYHFSNINEWFILVFLPVVCCRSMDSAQMSKNTKKYIYIIYIILRILMIVHICFFSCCLLSFSGFSTNVKNSKQTEKYI